MANIDTKLDAAQVLKQAYDEPNKRIRVDASVSASISDIKIEDSDGDTLEVNPDGSINVNVLNELLVEIDAADGDNVGLKIQERNLSPSDSQYNKRITAKTGTGSNADTTSMDMSIHDHQGNELTDRNPFQVSTNYEKIIEVVLKSAWMNLAVYDEVITTLSLDRSLITLSFKEDGYLIGEAVINFISDLNWNFILYRYILDDDGSQLLDDDDVPLFLD